MRFFMLSALLACGVLTCPATAAVAGVAGEAAIPDPARAWEFRDMDAVEAWLESASDGNSQNNNQKNNNRGRVAVLRARAWLARRDLEAEQALALIDQAISLAPDRPDLRVDRAAFRSDQIEEAGAFKSLRIARDVRRDLEHAIELAPEYTDALAALAAFHLKAPGIAGGDKQRAAELMSLLGELAPARLHFREALQLADEKRFAEAVDRIALALSLSDRPRPLWRTRMGDWQLRLEREDDAFDTYRQTLEESPRHAPAMLGLGRLAAESGVAVDAGVAALHRFLELPRWPQDPEARLAWSHLGRIYAQAGCSEQAGKAFRRALELEPGWSKARRSLEELTGAGTSKSCPDSLGNRSGEWLEKN